jgi:hypothetical protein
MEKSATNPHNTAKKGLAAELARVGEYKDRSWVKSENGAAEAGCKAGLYGCVSGFTARKKWRGGAVPLV